MGVKNKTAAIWISHKAISGLWHPTFEDHSFCTWFSPGQQILVTSAGNSYCSINPFSTWSYAGCAKGEADILFSRAGQHSHTKIF